MTQYRKKAAAFMIRMSPELHERLTERSEASLRSVTTEINLAVEDWLDSSRPQSLSPNLTGDFQFSCRMNPELREALKSASRSSNCSMNKAVLIAVDAWLSKPLAARPERMIQPRSGSIDGYNIKIPRHLHERIAAAAPERSVTHTVNELLEASFPSEDDHLKQLRSLIEQAAEAKAMADAATRLHIDALTMLCLQQALGGKVDRGRAIHALKTSLIRLGPEEPLHSSLS